MSNEVEFEKEIKKRIDLILLAMSVNPDAVEKSFEFSPFSGFKVVLSSKDKDILSRIIGRNGKNISAIRTIISIYASLRKIHVEVIASSKTIQES